MFGESLLVSDSGLNGRLEGGEVDVVQVAAAEAVDEMFEEVGWCRLVAGGRGRGRAVCWTLRLFEGVWESGEVVLLSNAEDGYIRHLYSKNCTFLSLLQLFDCFP